MNNPPVSAIILNFNGKKNLESAMIRCISSVLDSDYANLDVIFFDNGSTDNSVEFVKQKFQTNPKLRIITITDNCGIGIAYNKAMEQARGKYVVLLNNDVEVESSSIRKLVDVMEGDSAIGMASGKIMFFDNRLRINIVGNVFDLALGTHHIGYDQEDKGQYDSAFEPTFSPGACMILRRSMIERIGLFDPNYHFYHDDSDLGLRARLAGFKVMYVPTSIAYHKEGATRSSILGRSELTYHNLNSWGGLIIKNLAFKSILKNGVPMFVKYLLEIFYLLKDGQTFLVIRSILWRIRNFKNDWKKRLIVQRKIRRISDSELFTYFLDNSFLLFTLRGMRPLRWIFGSQDISEFDMRVTYGYYENHRVHTP